MMSRKMFQMTEKQLKKCRPSPEMPDDDWFKAMWKRTHHGKLTGWGMGKRDWIISNHKLSTEYQRGLWQGRVDRARGLDYSEKRIDKPYNLGYYRGYTGYESNRRGWDRGTCEWFDREYVNS
jgi:hypothetical protein